MPLEPTGDQLAQVTGTIVGWVLAHGQAGIGDTLSREAWDLIRDMVLEAAVDICRQVRADGGEVRDCIRCIGAMKGTP